MEAEERPTKLRKLEHKAPLFTMAADPNESSSVEPVVESSKPTESAANLAGSSSDLEVENPSQEVAKSPDVPPSPIETRVMDKTITSKPISKNQMKKALKKQQWEEGRDYRKAKRKEKAAEKKARKRAARDEQRHQTTENGETPYTNVPKCRRPVKVPITFVIDCGFDSLMMEKERISLGSQLTRSYSDNYRAPFQAHLVISSWGGLLKERFDTVLSKHYENWRGVRFLTGDFVEAAGFGKSAMSGRQGGKLVGAFQKYAQESKVEDIDTESSAMDPKQTESYKISETGRERAVNAGSAPESAQREAIPGSEKEGTNVHQSVHSEIVYLTSDSPYTLEELKPYSTYIIGGLVDKNRHKGICYKTACDKGIKTAKLPISEFMEMQSRFVLATNHVVEIMIRWLECGDWGEAFMKVIPKRKGGRLKQDDTCQASVSHTEEEDGGGSDEADHFDAEEAAP